MADIVLRVRRRAWQDIQVVCVSAGDGELAGVIVGRYYRWGLEAWRFYVYTEYKQRSDRSVAARPAHVDLMVDTINEVCGRSGEFSVGCWHSHPWADELDCLANQPLSGMDRDRVSAGGVLCVVTVCPPAMRRVTTEHTLVGEACGKRCVLEAWTKKQRKIVPVKMELCGRWR